jgi:hypothetical protein
MVEIGPVIRLELKRPGGKLLLVREWAQEAAPTIEQMENFPEGSLTDRRKKWDHPQDPVTHSATITEGSDEAVQEWLRGFSW